MRYLLDTNICIYLIKKRPEKVVAHFKQHPPRDVAVSIITVFELEYGVQKSRFRKRSQEALGKFLLPFMVLNLDRASVEEAAAIRCQLEKTGMTIGPYDILIAGLARSRNMTLVTNNTREFERVEGLALENWAGD